VVSGPYEYGVPGAVHAVFGDKKQARTAAGAAPAPAGGGGAPPPTTE